jgi:hypothetical protein
VCKLKSYDVAIIETRKLIVTVEAADPTEASDIVINAWCRGEHIAKLATVEFKPISHRKEVLDMNNQKPNVSSKETAIQFQGDRTQPEGKVIPEVLLLIQRTWKGRADTHGDDGTCVLCAALTFIYEGQAYIMPHMSRWQGCISWEHCLHDICAMLVDVGATDIHYDRGFID